MAVLKQWVEPKKLAVQRATLRGGIAPGSLPRLAGSVLNLANIQAELAFASDHRRRPEITGRLSAQVSCECQRCLEPVTLELAPPIHWVAVRSEGELADLDPEVEGWLVLEDEVDLYHMVEDELLLALPLVAFHAHACVDLAASPEPDMRDEAADNPFDVLKQLKSRPTQP